MMKFTNIMINESQRLAQNSQRLAELGQRLAELSQTLAETILVNVCYIAVTQKKEDQNRGCEYVKKS